MSCPMLEYFLDTVKILNKAYDDRYQIVVEGTQGALLDFHMGHYPYVTTRQTNATSWLAEAGFAPSVVCEVVMVLRTFPIRVAGNSGYMGKELRWTDLARKINKKRVDNGMEILIDVSAIRRFDNMEMELIRGYNDKIGADLPYNPTDWTDEQKIVHSEFLVNLHKRVSENLDSVTMTELKKFFEFTTVTKKLRRIAEMNEEELKHAVRLNRPASLCVNFLNYMFPTLVTANTYEELIELPEWKEANAYLTALSRSIKTQIRWVNVNPNGIITLTHSIGIEYHQI